MCSGSFFVREYLYRSIFNYAVNDKSEGREYNIVIANWVKMTTGRLCAYRDAGFMIHMESMGWSFDVTKMAGTIDNHAVELLAYDVQERKFTDNAVLVLGNVDANAYKAFLSAMNSFYYIGNPVLGKCIRCTDDFAVYHTNEKGERKAFCPYAGADKYPRRAACVLQPPVSVRQGR